MKTRVLILSVMAAYGSGFSALNAAVVLNEILIDPSVADGNSSNSGEWVELFGTPGDSIGGWVISDGDAAITIPAGTVIPSDGFYLVGNSTINSLSPDLDTSGFYSDGSTAIPELSLTNSGEFTAIFDSSFNLVDGLIWIEDVVGDGNAPSGQSVSLFGGGTLLVPNLTDVDNPSSPWNWIGIDGGADETLARSMDGTGGWVASGDLNGNTPGASNTAVVPEPSAGMLSVLGLGLLLFRRRR